MLRVLHMYRNFLYFFPKLNFVAINFAECGSLRVCSAKPLAKYSEFRFVLPYSRITYSA